MGGIISGTIIGVIKGHTRSLDYSSHNISSYPKTYLFLVGTTSIYEYSRY